jgi:hypothetical protein
MWKKDGRGQDHGETQGDLARGAVQFIFGAAVLAAVLAVGEPAWEHVGKPAWNFVLPPVATNMPPPPAGCYQVPWPPGTDCNDDKERDYVGDIRVSDVISRYGTKSVIVLFHSNSHMRTAAIRQMLVEIHIDLVHEVTEVATLTLKHQAAALQAESAKAERGPLSAFRWQTKEELRRNWDEIKRVERNLQQYKRQAREEANAISDWSSGSTVVETSPNRREHRSVADYRTGPIYRQLQRIAEKGGGS